MADCKTCGKGPLSKDNTSGLCKSCFGRELGKKWGRNASDSLIDWASTPCPGCGKWPLSVNNKTGWCRTCSRTKARFLLYPRHAA